MLKFSVICAYCTALWYAFALTRTRLPVRVVVLTDRTVKIKRRFFSTYSRTVYACKNARSLEKSIPINALTREKKRKRCVSLRIIGLRPPSATSQLRVSSLRLRNCTFRSVLTGNWCLIVDGKNQRLSTMSSKSRRFIRPRYQSFYASLLHQRIVRV